MPQRQTITDEIADRRAQVAALRLARRSMSEIARALDVSKATVVSDMAAIRSEWAERRLTAYEDWIGEELATLDALQRSMLPLARTGQEKAVDRVLAIMDRRSRLLGLDQPERHEHVVITKDLVSREIERLEEELARRESEKADA